MVIMLWRGESPCCAGHDVQKHYKWLLCTLTRRPLCAQVAEALGMLEWGEVVDLHGYHAVEGRVAVLCMLAAIQERYRQGHDVTDLIVVTGEQSDTQRLEPVI
jgi:hypothetical protein